MRLSIRKLFAGLAVAVAVLAFSAAHAADDAATVICKDGATSPGGRGACRGHGGVDKAKTKAQGSGDAKAAAAAPKAADKSSSAASDAMVVCKDGTSSKGGRGACRGHGGVDKSGGAKGSAAPAPAAATPAPAPAPAAAKAAPAAATKAAPAAASADESKGTPIAKCKDGTLSYSKHHSGSCSRHGGVAEWLDKK